MDKVEEDAASQLADAQGRPSSRAERPSPRQKQGVKQRKLQPKLITLESMREHLEGV